VLVVVIGRGHSGTRAIAKTLVDSGVNSGKLNDSYDMVPAEPMHEAARIASDFVVYSGHLRWDFKRLLRVDAPAEWHRLVDQYVKRLMSLPVEHKGWKLPETFFSLPWVVKKWPEAYYIYVVRDPRDVILGGHLSNTLGNLGVSCPETPNGVFERRAISWLYQYELVRVTPKPRRWFQVRLEDFVEDQVHTLCDLSNFLNLPLVKIPVRPGVVGRWRSRKEGVEFPFLKNALAELGYDKT